MNKLVRQNLALTGLWSSAASFLLTVVWVACMILLGDQHSAEATVVGNPALVRLNFGVCLLLALIQVPLLVALAGVAFRKAPIQAVTGGLLALCYVPINALAYFLNVSVIPRLVTIPLEAEVTRTTLAAAIWLPHPFSLLGSGVALGYGLLGLGWAIMAAGMFGAGRAWAVTSILMTATGFAAGAGVLGGILGIATLCLGTVVSGGFALLAYIGMMVGFAVDARRASKDGQEAE